MTDNPALLDARTVARLCGFSNRTLWRMVRAGGFPQPVRFNRKLVKWPLVSIEDWLTSVGACLPPPPPAHWPELPRDLITPKDAAELIGCHVSTIHRWVKVGQLTGYVRGGARYTVSRAAVLAQVRELEPAGLSA